MLYLASLSLWRQRELQVLYTLASGLTDMREFRLATKMYEEILVKDADNACFTYSTLARVCLLVSVVWVDWVLLQNIALELIDLGGYSSSPSYIILVMNSVFYISIHTAGSTCSTFYIIRKLKLLLTVAL